MKPSCTRGLGALFAVLLGTLATSAARADLIFETNFGSAPQGSGTTIGEYTTAGGTINAALVTGLSAPTGIAVSGSDLFVANSNGHTIGEYTTSGAPVNPALITGLGEPLGIAVSGSDLFVTNGLSGTIGEYTTAGAVVNAALVTGLFGPAGIAVAPTPVAAPEPGTLALLGAGFAGTGILQAQTYRHKRWGFCAAVSGLAGGLPEK